MEKQNMAVGFAGLTTSFRMTRNAGGFMFSRYFKSLQRNLKIAPTLILIVSSTILKAQDEIIEVTLDNGMTVVIKENHTAQVVALRAYVRAGSIYEGEYLGCGISHYFEHVLSGGTTTNHTEDYFNQLKQDIGASYNAYTSKDHTCYHLTINSKYFDEALGMLADWLMNCAFDSIEIAREKGVILKEILMRETPRHKAWEIFNNTLYKTHPARYPVIGYTDLFKKITREDILAYYDRFYVPGNMLFVAVGDFNKDTVLSKIKDAFKDFERKPLDFPILPEEPRQTSKRVVETELDISAAEIRIGYHTVNILNDDMYPLDILAYILGEGKNSRLNKILKEKRQVVNYVYSYSNTPHYVDGAFIIGAETSDLQNIEEIKRIIFNEIEKLKKKYISNYEIEKAKKQILATKLLRSQDIGSQASIIGRNWIGTMDPNFYDTYVQKIQKVTKKDVKRVANKYFYATNMVVVVIKPIGLKKLVVKDTVSKKVSVGDVQKLKLDNGVTLLLKRNPNFSTVSINVAFEGGTRYETEENNGITIFMVEMLLRGTKKRTAEEIAEEFEKIGGSIHPTASRDEFELTIDILKHDLNHVLDVLSDILSNSTFPDDEVEKLRKEILADIQRQEDNPRTMANRFFYQQLYTKHPYRLPTLGTEKSIAGIAREEIKAYYEKFVVPNNMVLGIFGNYETSLFDEKTIVAKVKRAFKGFKCRTDRPKGLFLLEIPPEPELLDSKEVFNYYRHPQATIFWGFPTVKSPRRASSEEDYYILKVIQNIFGGNRSRLHYALRGEKDLVYYVHGYQPTEVDRSTFVITAQTSLKNYEEVVGIFKREVKKLKDESLTEEELEGFKREIINKYPIYYQTNSAQVGRAVFYETIGLGYQFFDEFLDNIQKVTSEDIQRVANKYFTKSVLAVSIPEKE